MHIGPQAPEETSFPVSATAFCRILGARPSRPQAGQRGFYGANQNPALCGILKLLTNVWHCETCI